MTVHTLTETDDWYSALERIVEAAGPGDKIRVAYSSVLEVAVQWLREAGKHEMGICVEVTSEPDELPMASDVRDVRLTGDPIVVTSTKPTDNQSNTSGDVHDQDNRRLVHIKPEMKTQAPAYDFLEITEYIEAKYGINTRKYKPEDGERRDFWHSVIEVCDPKRGSYLTMSGDWYFGEEWEREVLGLYLAEFGPRVRCWVDW